MMGMFRCLLLCACAAGMPAAAHAVEPQPENLAPYKMMRSLQTVQDAVVHGDYSSADMQVFMVGAIDKRLRAADRAVFNDPRNVDAALIYAMSGGNPATLAYLASRDIEGNFDSRLTDALGHYLNGKGGLVVESLSKTLPEYQNGQLAPYLYLVFGNAVAQQDTKKAIKAYDRARLAAPGTNIEEAALRRSLMLTVRDGETDKAFRYARNYTRRFMTSPYASQFADIFVGLAVATYGETTRDRIEEVLSFMDRPRQREIYLRIARNAAISGMQPLTKLASERAAALSSPSDAEPKALATLYSGLVNVPSTGILDAVKDIAAIPEAELSPRDRILRQAAQAVAQEVLRAPAVPLESPAQAIPAQVAPAAPSSGDLAETGSGASPFAAPASSPVAAAGAEQSAQTPMRSASADVDPALSTFLTNGNNKLGEIDALLREGK